MKKFDLHASRNFNNDSYFGSFEVKSVDDFYENLILYWDKAGLREGRDEMIITSKVEFEGEIYDFNLGHYVVADDEDEVEALFNTPDKDEIESSITKHLIGDYAGMNEDDMFERLVEALIK